MDTITLGDKTFEKYISAQEIDDAITKIASQINKDYEGEIPVFIITLNGAVFFATDLLKKLSIETYVTCVKLSSYAGIKTTNKMNQLIGLSENLQGKRVVILEDVVDTGNTYEYIMKILESEGAKDVRIATMTYKPEAYTKSYPVHYAALTIPTKFIVGRGLDYDGLGRNLPDIYQIVTE